MFMINTQDIFFVYKDILGCIDYCQMGALQSFEQNGFHPS